MTSQPAMTLMETAAPARQGSVVNIERSERELRRQLTRFSKWMYRLGFAPGTSGNLSVRLDEESILATPTGCSKYLLRPSDMVIANLNGKLLSGTRNVTSEIGMHVAVYAARPDVQAVVHAHPPIATAFASCGMALDQPLCAELLMTLGKIPLASYATTGTDEVGASLEPYLLDHDAILMANHGLVTYGQDLLDAFMKLETTEHFAQVCLAAHQLGCATPLGEEAIGKLQQARLRYRSNCRM
ncbi:class II aldolase/adducin family protein [Acidobacterium sp. S8]|uniref:class II aldolase/adducin family protein n=1 Tax=Acidobacterium sp. S8 TaxID=1641854 RepID=UPI0020B15A98|nr:class II aldolase/adducin family protein [Acidobacterium sp. S8]